MSKRIWSTVPDDVDEELRQFAKESGIDKSALIALAVKAGLGALKRAATPEKYITADLMQAVIEAQEKIEKIRKTGD